MDKEIITKTQDSKKTRLAKVIIGPIISLHLFSYVSSGIILAQYGYYAFHKLKFPNDNSTTETQFTCETNTSTLRYRQQVSIQQDTSKWSLYITLAVGVPGIFVNLLFGTYSDRFGRKMFLSISLIGTFIRSCLCGVAIYMGWNVYVFVGFVVIDGITSAQLGPVTIAHAIAADLTDTGKSRTFAIALIEVASGIGVLLGMFASGYMIKGLGFTLPFLITAVLAFFSLVLCFFVLPETHIPSQTAKSIPLPVYLKNAFSFYVKKPGSEDDKRIIYITCILIFIFSSMGNLGRFHVDILYELNAPFCWDSIQIGIYGMLRTALTNVVGLPMIRLLQRCLSDETIGIIGALSGTLSMIQESFAPNSIVLYLVVLTGIGGTIPQPVTKGIMSRMTSSDKQGSLFSGIGAITIICNILGTLSANGIYAATVEIYRGIVYCVMAAFYTIAIVLLILIKSCRIPMDQIRNENEFWDTSAFQRSDWLRLEFTSTEVDTEFAQRHLRVRKLHF